MTILAALVKEQGVTFVTVMVKPFVISSPSHREQWLATCHQLFGVGDVVLISENGQTYGSPRVVRFLQSISVQQLPWRQYSVN